MVLGSAVGLGEAVGAGSVAGAGVGVADGDVVGAGSVVGVDSVVAVGLGEGSGNGADIATVGDKMSASDARRVETLAMRRERRVACIIMPFGFMCSHLCEQGQSTTKNPF